MFDYKEFDAQCSVMTTDQLLQQHRHYNKLTTASMTGTVVSALSIPLTFGLSAAAIGASAPAHHNAKKKKVIIEKYLKARGIEAAQAAQYANNMAYEQQQQQNQMWLGQQGWQNPSNATPRGPPSDVKTAPVADEHADKKKYRKSGVPALFKTSSPTPPPSYNDTVTARNNYTSPSGMYSQPAWGPPQGGYASPPQQWAQPPTYNVPQQGSWSQAQPATCGAQATMYPNSAMYHGHPSGPDDRHVHFSSQTSLIP